MRSFEEQLQDAIELIQPSRRIVALTGAGISTESGIPDFRSPGSTWLQQPPVSYQDFISKPEARQKYWQTRRTLSGQVGQAKPNEAHYALAKLERMGMLLGIITQNFDGLHRTRATSRSASSNCTAPRAKPPARCAMRAPPCRNSSSASTRARSTPPALYVMAI